MSSVDGDPEFDPVLFNCPDTTNLATEVLGVPRVNYSNAGAYTDKFSRMAGHQEKPRMLIGANYLTFYLL